MQCEYLCYTLSDLKKTHENSFSGKKFKMYVMRICHQALILNEDTYENEA